MDINCKDIFADHIHYLILVFYLSLNTIQIFSYLYVRASPFLLSYYENARDM